VFLNWVISLLEKKTWVPWETWLCKNLWGGKVYDVPIGVKTLVTMALGAPEKEPWLIPG